MRVSWAIVLLLSLGCASRPGFDFPNSNKGTASLTDPTTKQTQLAYFWKLDPIGYFCPAVELKSPAGGSLHIAEAVINLLYTNQGEVFGAVVTKASPNSKIDLNYGAVKIDQLERALVKFRPRGAIWAALLQSIANGQASSQPDSGAETFANDNIYYSFHAGKRVTLPDFDTLSVCGGAEKNYALGFGGRPGFDLELLARTVGFNVLKSLLADAHFNTLKTELFDIVYSNQIDRRRIEEKARVMEEKTRALVAKYHLPSLPPVHIVWFRDDDEARGYVARPLGFTLADRSIIFMHDRQSYTHEISHVVGFQLFGPVRRAVWDEGFSVYNDGNDRTIADLADLDHGAANSADNLRAQAFRKTRELSYPQAGAFVGYLLENYSLEQFKALWASDYSSANELDAAFVATFGQGFEAIVERFRQFLRDRPRQTH